MFGRSSAGRSGNRGRGSGGSNSIRRGGSNSIIRSGRNVSGDNTSYDEPRDQYDELENLNGTNSPEIGSPSSVAPHSNASSNFAADPNRLWISVTPDLKRFVKGNGRVDNGEVIRSITTILKQYYRGVWPTWTSIPKEEQDKMFERFKLMYCWDPAIDTSVRFVFDAAIARRLSDRLSMDRDAACVKAAAAGNPVTEYDISSIIPYNPSWMKQEYWAKLVEDHWNTESWLKMSQANKDNRGKFVAGYHCTGSAGYVSFREKLEAKRGPQSSLSFLILSHTKKEKRDQVLREGSTTSLPSSEDLIDDRAREAVDRLKSSMIEKYGEDETTHPKYDLELWERATGEKKKGRSYCSGTSDPSFVLTGTPSVNSKMSWAQTSSQEVERVKQTMEEMREAHEKAKQEMEEREERLKKEVEDSKALAEEVRKEMREQIAEIMKHIPNFKS